ncbi:apolipoprotein N-acyltransferase, partial [Acidithiobacillus ferridurans]|nr:apolipoprotein N-acyltransferase [Acidithiobacillus ferridurans]
MAFSRLVWIAGLVLGACWPLAFAPFDQSYLAIILLVGLFAIADRASPRLAAWTGFTFGLSAFAVGIYWLAIPLHNFAHMDWVLSGTAVLLLAFYCALYPALALWIARKWWPRKGLFALPFVWVLSEWLRAHLFTGFPWLATGYSQTWSILGGWAPLL